MTIASSEKQFKDIQMVKKGKKKSFSQIALGIMIHLLIRMGCISTPFLFYQSFVCVCRHERHRLSLFLYIYTHGKSSPSSHTKREQMIDNLAEKRRACRPMSRCGQKAKKFSFFFSRWALLITQLLPNTLTCLYDRI